MTLENARDFYGRVLTASQDLQTDACCTAEAPAPGAAQALASLHPAHLREHPVLHGECLAGAQQSGNFSRAPGLFGSEDRAAPAATRAIGSSCC